MAVRPQTRTRLIRSGDVEPSLLAESSPEHACLPGRGPPTAQGSSVTYAEFELAARHTHTKAH
jgi:hypothetical protein